MRKNEKKENPSLKDQEVLKKYFSREYNLFTKEMRQKLGNLALSARDKTLLKREIAFLSEPKQREYFEEINSPKKKVKKRQ